MTKHTPGPWKNEEGYRWLNARSDDRVIADMRIVGGVIEDEVKANARLIAAAPDLLEALESVADIWANAKPGDQSPFGITARRIAAAIAKARGE